jgi:glycosyltransferase involved in cell wall biosynthesis
MINKDNPTFSDTPASRERAWYPYGPSQDTSPITVSIITPFYNTDKVIEETADSVFGQSFQEWEWIIVDDGSTLVEARERLAELGGRDRRVRIIRQENRGPSAARNTAFRQSRGRYLCLLDSDDLLEPTYIEKCLWFLESQPDFAFCNSWSVAFGDREYLWPTGFEIGKEHIYKNSGPPISVIRRAAYEAVGGFNESIRIGHEDWDFWLSLASGGFWGYTLPEYLEWYRVRKSGRFEQIMKDESLRDGFEKYIGEKYGDLEARFPAPQLRQPRPFESVPADLPFENRLSKADKKRILFLIPWMVTGGADKVNLDWLKGLRDHGYEVSVCATLSSYHNWLPEFTRLTPDVFILPNFLHTADFPRFITYLILSRQIDTVLVSGSIVGYQLLPYLRSRCPGVSFVDLCHVEEMHWQNGGHPRCGVGYQDMLDLNIVTTSYLRAWMAGRGADASRIEVCYTGVDLAAMDAVAQRRSSIRGALGVADDMPVIVFAGRICSQKRPQLFAEILRDVAQKGIDFGCFVIGDGDLRPVLERLLREYSLESLVTMVGTVDHEKWLELLAISDIFLLPSEYEGISVALYESMAMRHVVPVMADVGGQSEIVTADSGFLVRKGPSEREDYVDAVSFLIRNPSRKAEMAAAGRDRISRGFTLDQGVLRLISILKRAELLARDEPRLPVAPGLAQELATLTVEYARLTGVADFLWAHWLSSSPKDIDQPPLPVIKIAKLVMLIAQTKVGQIVLWNRVVRSFGKWIMKKLEGRR